MMLGRRDEVGESTCTLAITDDDVEDRLDAAVLHATSEQGTRTGPNSTMV